MAETKPAAPQEGTSFAAKLRTGCRRCYSVLSSHVGLIVALLVISFIGAAVFQAVEGPHEFQEKLQIMKVRESVLQSIWNNSRQNQAVWFKKARSEMVKYEQQVRTAASHGVSSDTNEKIWSFWGSLFYVGTVYTTIGYGHIAPATDAGRIITILYSIVGIPLCLIVLADLGKLFTKFLKFLWSFVRRFYYTGSCRKIRRTSPVRTLEEKLKNMDKRKEGETAAAPAEPQESNGHVVDADPGYVVDDDFNLPPFVAIAIVFIYIFLGALMYRQWEDWTYLEAFYFIFISVSTIGFGDVLPEHPNYFLVSSLYVFIGLALVSMVINVLIEFFSKTLDEAKRKMEQVSKTIGISLDDGIEAETANVTTAQQTNAQLDPKAGAK